MPRTEAQIAVLENFFRLWNRLRELVYPYGYQEVRDLPIPTSQDETELADLRYKILVALPEVQYILRDSHKDLAVSVSRALDSARSLHDLTMHPEFRETFRRDWALVQQLLACGIGEVALRARLAANPLYWVSRWITAIRRSVTYRDIAWWFILSLAVWKILEWAGPFLNDLRSIAGSFFAGAFR
ncbi:MAG: hypothetical protein V2G42_00970 [bacterium JZ-2024 1]